MEVHKGDHLIIEGRKIGQGHRTGEITRVEGSASSPRMWVRWEDGHESLLMPGPGIRVETKRGKSTS